MTEITYAEAIEYVSFVVDDAGMGCSLSANQHAQVCRTSVLVGWSTGDVPIFVAANSYLGFIPLEIDEAVWLATDFLAERGWFGETPPPPDWILLSGEPPAGEKFN